MSTSISKETPQFPPNDTPFDPSLCRCGAPPTASKRNPVNSTPAKCLSCAAIDRYQLDPQNQRTLPIPPHIQSTPVARIHPHDSLWNHQALATQELLTGANVVVATPTASGKTLIFHLHTLTMLHHDPQAATLVLYPAKALANDQLMRWKQAAQTAGFSPDSIQQITGDVPMRQRQDLLRTASVILMPPDVVHAWMIRSAHSPAVSAFLRRLRLIITDEAHVYEDVLGTNAAFMFRRLDTAVRAAGNPALPQHLAATATIQVPHEHMENLTGHPFVSLDYTHNGAPRYPTELLHQRLGRVGRSRPATFIILADHRIFQRHSESLSHYYQNSVDPSRLHLDNEYIAYQHALCLRQESQGSSRHTSGLAWPPAFAAALALTEDPNPPRDLAHVRARSAQTPPQLAYSLRSTGEETLDIVPCIDGQDTPQSAPSTRPTPSPRSSQEPSTGTTAGPTRPGTGAAVTGNPTSASSPPVPLPPPQPAPCYARSPSQTPAPPPIPPAPHAPPPAATPTSP